MISKESIEAIINASHIEEVVQDFVQLKKRGVNYLGLCPFHKENTPSFTVSPVKGIYKCFGCGKGGNAVNFVMEYKNIKYHDALKYLASKYQITIPNIDSEKGTKPETIANRYSLEDILASEIENYIQNSSSVFKLMNFDSLVLEFCIVNIEALNDRIKNNSEIKITVPSLTADSTLNALRNIYDNESMKNQYKTIYNQCLVLLVSYFSSSIKELFRKTIQYLIDEDIPFLGNLKGDIKLGFDELENSKFDLKKCIVDLVIDKKNISFQDMKSIARAFDDFFSIKIEQTKDVDNIILGLASRHAIVHNLSQADHKFITQIGFAKNRTLMKKIKIYDPIEFEQDEIKIINKSMYDYLSGLIKKVNTRFQLDR